jgi:hypothetical protein
MVSSGLLRRENLKSYKLSYVFAVSGVSVFSWGAILQTAR